MSDAMPVKLLCDKAVLPVRKHLDDAGLDLCSTEECRIEPGRIRIVGTGLAVALPKGHGGFILPRSGLACKYGVTVVNSPGLVDANYRGEIKVGLINLGFEAYTIKEGDRIAQMVVVPYKSVICFPVNELEDTERGASGFGSTGK